MAKWYQDNVNKCEKEILLHPASFNILCPEVCRDMSGKIYAGWIAILQGCCQAHEQILQYLTSSLLNERAKW